MGFRTVVVLSNDLSSYWENDPLLGRKISHYAAMSKFESFPYGNILEQVHADTQTLAVLDGYNGKPVSYSHWYSSQTAEQRNLDLVKEAADKMGYRLVKNQTREL